MQPMLPTDAEVESWLQTLGVESLCQWDVLIFLFRHQSTLESSCRCAAPRDHENGASGCYAECKPFLQVEVVFEPLGALSPR
jgi:hypothetical protein